MTAEFEQRSIGLVSLSGPTTPQSPEVGSRIALDATAGLTKTEIADMFNIRRSTLYQH